MSRKTNPLGTYTVHNSIELIKGGATYFTLIKKLILAAGKEIFIRVYIWENDATGKTIADALIDAAHRGVAIYIIADGYASQNLSGTFINRLKAAGIHFRFFEPLLKSSHFYFGRRMHEKVIAIDENIALVGGINFSNRYNDVNSVPAWLDYALLTKGECARQLYNYCKNDWLVSINNENTLNPNQFPVCSVRIRKNDWVKGKHQIWKTYFNWFNQAEESITIMCSYFLPGSVLRKRLIMAAKRGVKVKIILGGPCDVPIAKYAERYLYNSLLKNGIKIYEYQPTVLHAKMMVVDGHWFTIGSFNVNNISAYASTELNLDIRNKPFAGRIHELLEQIINDDCIEVNKNSFITNATFFKKFLQKSAYETIRVILNLSTFYFKHE